MSNQENHGKALEQFSAIWSRRWRLILSVFLIVVIPGAIAVVALPDVYEAQAIVVPQGNALTQYSNADSSQSGLDVITERVLSRDRLGKLITEFNLYPATRSRATLPTAVMRKNILIQTENSRSGRGNQPYAFSVSFRGGDPQKVASVTNRLAASYETVAKKMKNDEYSSAVATLKDRLELLRGKMDGQQKLIDRYQSGHRGQLPEEQGANLAAIQRLDSRLRDNDAKQLQLMESRTTLLQQTGGAEESSLPQLEQRLANLELSYTDKYPEVVALKTRIARLKENQSDKTSDGAALQSPYEKQLNSLNAELSGLKREEARLRTRLAAYQRYLDDAPLTAQKLKALTQGYTETSNLYATLLTHYEQVRITHATSAQSGPSYRVLESAMVPTVASGPSRLRLFAVIFILGLGLAALAAVVAEQRDTSFHSLEEVREYTSLPVLATIPLISTPRDIRQRRLRRGAILFSVLCLVGILGAGAAYYAHSNQMLSLRFSHHTVSTST